MRKRYETYGHAKCRLRYHFIFSTKYRRDCLKGIEDEVERAFAAVAKVSHFKVLRVGVDCNHVHLLVSSRPRYSVASIVHRLKSQSRDLLWESCAEHLKQFYWGAKRRLWSGGYFCATVGEASEETVDRYIAEQG